MSLAQARRRIAAYVKAHESNPYQQELVLGMVGMNGKPLLRITDIKALLEATKRKD